MQYYSLNFIFTGTSKGHLETKKQILEIRKKYGEDKWLISHAGIFVQDIMGLQPSTCPTLLTPDYTVQNLDAIFISESLPKGISEVNNEEDNEITVLKEEENDPEALSISEINALMNISEPPYDPKQGIL